MKNLAHKSLKVDRDPVSDAFYSRVMARARWEGLVEPALGDMRAVPAAAKFISSFKEPLTFREITKTDEGHTSEKAILILDKNRKELGIIRWIGGEGEPFFYHFLGKQESVESILAQVPVPTAPEAPVAAKPAKPEYPVHVSKTRNVEVFKVRKDDMPFESLVNLLITASTLDLWTVRSRFSALKIISQASDFLANFKDTKLNYELAVKVENNLIRSLREAAIYVYGGSSKSPLAVMKYVAGEGMMFFQNLLDDKSQSVDAVLASLKGAQHAPADGRPDSRNLFWMDLPQQSK
jgi:hypothetical protein